MTFTTQTKTPVNLTAWHGEYDGEKGYWITVGSGAAFVLDAEADRLARYLLFEGSRPETEGDTDAA